MVSNCDGDRDEMSEMISIHSDWKSKNAIEKRKIVRDIVCWHSGIFLLKFSLRRICFFFSFNMIIYNNHLNLFLLSFQ